MYYWYRFFTYLFFPISPIYLYFRRIRKKEDLIRWREKLSEIKITRAPGFLVWFHVASVGEAMSVLPLINYVIKDSKVSNILITSITLSSGKILKKKYDSNSKVVHQYLPLDIPFFVNKFLDHWKPNLSIFIDSEVWPNLILEINKKKIPLLLVNARITKKSFERWKFSINFAKKIFEKFNLCLTSNKESENFLKTLGAKNVKNYGNIKYSGVENNKNKKLNSTFLDKVKNKKIWCAASTHPSEELFCAKSHIKIKKISGNVLTIIIPRHIERVETIQKELLKLNLNIVLSSNLEQVNEDTDILLVDAYGEALKFYDISKYVFLGKSLISALRNDSGQNPIEPAKKGCKIFHGPYVSNFNEAYNYLNELGITKQVNELEELSLSLVEEFKKDEPKNHDIAMKIENYGQNILNNVTSELKKYI